MSFDASASTAPGGVAKYNWDFGGREVETASPTITHEFLTGDVYEVALTVYAADGTSGGTAQEVGVGSVPAPAITKITPKKGPNSGGTLVTISGSSLTSVTAVTFGTVAASGFYAESVRKGRNSSYVINVPAPAGAAGTADVRVTRSFGGTSAITTKDRFKYANPTVTSVSPSSGPTAGGTTVTVNGTGFSSGAGTTLLFGKTPGTSVNCSSLTECTVISPAATEAGAVDVIAAVGKAKSKKSPPGDLFTYN
jgi:hypothetical protein